MRYRGLKEHMTDVGLSNRYFEVSDENPLSRVWSYFARDDMSSVGYDATSAKPYFITFGENASNAKGTKLYMAKELSALMTVKLLDLRNRRRCQ